MRTAGRIGWYWLSLTLVAFALSVAWVAVAFTVALLSGTHGCVVCIR